MFERLRDISVNKVYAIAIITVASLITINQLVIQQLLSARRTDANVINLAGKQRMHSQKIALTSYEALSDFSQLEILKLEVQELSDVNQALQHGDEGRVIPANDTEEIAILFDAINPIVEDLQRIVNSIESPEDLRQRQAEILDLMNRFLPIMDQTVGKFQEHSELEMERLVLLEMFLAIVSVLILLLEVQFVFKTILRDLANKKEQLEETNLSKDRILATVVHDLRNPLNGIKGLSDVLQDELKGELNEEQAMMFEMIDESSDKADKLIQELLEMSLLESEEFHLETEVTHLGEYLMSTLAYFKNKAEEKGVDLKVSILNDELKVKIDQQRFSRVIDNLLSNALKFTDRPGEVEVSTREEGNKVIITVRDTGIGIPKDMQQFIFDKFSKARRLGLHGEKTTGLGMSIVKQIVELHKGSIWLESQEDKGTEFYISLPKVPAEGAFAYSP